METLELLLSRRSIRSYTGEKVSKEVEQAVLKAGYAAPVGMGRYDGLHITVITDPGFLSDLDRAGAEMFGKPDIHPLYGAPELILVSVCPAGETIGNVEYSNAAIVAHNMSLAADDAGAGTVLIWGAIRALNNSPQLVARLGLPEGFLPCCALTLGVTKETYAVRDIPDGRIGTTYL